MISDREIDHAVAVLRAGGLVAFPTETVYGLGADAGNPAAVRKIFEVKGRPSTHPVIVHLADAVQLANWAREVSEVARKLTRQFWPGPLTLVLKRAPGVSDAVTGGQDTVALRVPDHPLALEVLRAFGDGVAAPSANRFGHVSPTTAQHVRDDLGPDVDLVLDGGPCRVGVESTIVDLATDPTRPRILRTGAVLASDVARVLGVPVGVPVGLVAGVPVDGGDPPPPPEEMRVPGSHDVHYAPRAGVELVSATVQDEERLKLVDRTADVILMSREAIAQGLEGRVQRPERVRPWTYEFDPAGLEHLRRAIDAAIARRRPTAPGTPAARPAAAEPTEPEAARV